MLIALPLTVLANFFLMRLAGFSLNIFSLGGLVVAMSVVIDNSIVVMENVTRLGARGEGDRAEEAGTEQVATPILFATVTFLALFLPFLLVPGLASLLFRELILVVAGVLVLSLVVALTVTPAAARWLKVGAAGHGRPTPVERALERLTAWYRRLLARLLHRPAVVVAAVVVLFAGSLVALGEVGSEFLPKVDDGRVMVKVMMPAGTSVAEVDRILGAVEERIAGLPEVESVFTLAGGRVWGLATMEIPYEGEVDIQLVPKHERRLSTAEFVSKVQPLVREVDAPGGRINVAQMKVKGIRQVGTQEVEVKVRSGEIPALFGFARDLAEALRGTDGLTNVNVSMDLSKPEYRVLVERDRASALGISVQEIALTLRGLVRGEVATLYREGAEYYPVRVMVPEPLLTGKEALERLVVADRGGTPVTLRELAEVRRAVGPVEIAREDQAKQIVVRADSSGTSVGEAAARAAAVVATLEPPPGVEVTLGGQAQMMRESLANLGLVLAFSLFFGYVVLAIQFESFVQPFLILVRVPLSLVGFVAALLLTGLPVGATVLIGVVILAGNEIYHGVVLLGFVNELRAGGLPVEEAVLEGSAVRLRPILMTLSAMTLGLLPLALGIGEGGDMLVPMAVAVIGGLLVSLVMTLVFLPCAYKLLPGRVALSRLQVGAIPSLTT
jgi:hydrophobic/amphiphilic exporter-1 (mainly G- bacteria), HAE1 family